MLLIVNLAQNHDQSRFSKNAIQFEYICEINHIYSDSTGLRQNWGKKHLRLFSAYQKGKYSKEKKIDMSVSNWPIASHTKLSANLF